MMMSMPAKLVHKSTAMAQETLRQAPVLHALLRRQ